MNKIKEVMQRVYEPKRLIAAWQRVKENAGSAGIDGMKIQDFIKRYKTLMRTIYRKLKEGLYRFKPARRVEIPKPGTTKTRKLGIPVIMDRITAQSINTVLEEIYDPEFTESNYGFRKGRNQHMAIKHVQEIVKEGYNWCVSVDLKSFFDEIPHNLMLKLIRRKIADEKFVTLIARALKAGVVVDGRFEKTEKGCPQGSPLSPILSNIVLNELDQELEKRKHKYCRWADDFVILVKTERAGHRVLTGIKRFLETELGLKVNKEKSGVSEIKNVTFLGFQILREKIRISNKSRDKFKKKIRELTHRNNPLSMYQIIEELNMYLRGWVNYFRLQEFKQIFKRLDEWIRSRLRSMQLKKWKKPKKFQRIMIKAGFLPEKAKKVWIQMKKWQSVNRKEVRFTLNLEWFRNMGLVFLNDYTLTSPKP